MSIRFFGKDKLFYLMNSLDYSIISIFYTILYQIYAFIDFNEEFDPAHVERMLHNQKQDGGVGGSY